MSSNFRLICEETKQKIWVGQGWVDKGMETFYSDDKLTMIALGKFLREHEGKNIKLVNSDYYEGLDSYPEIF